MTSKTHYSLGSTLSEQRSFALSGRNRWALDALIAAGKQGITSLDNPAPRLAAYVFNLRELGVEIETIHEPHAGTFSGTHARYVLRSVVTKGDAA